MNIALAVFATIGAVLLLMLALASANTSLFERHFPLLLAVNGAAAVALIALVGWRLRILWREYRARIFGSRLKWRLLVMFILMAVMPAALVYAVSVQFAERSIDSWFDVRVDKALEDGLNLGRTVLDQLRADLLQKANGMAQDLSASSQLPVLNNLRNQAGVQSATVLSLSGRVLANSSGEFNTATPSLPTEAQLLRVRQNGGFSSIEGDAASGMVLRVIIPVMGLSLAGEQRVLQLVQPVPVDFANSAESVAATYRNYQELQLSRAGLKRIFLLTLTFTLLLTLFAAIAFAFFLAERLVRPLLLLAEGTQAVGAGDFTPRQAIKSHDELGLLTQSFSQMTQQLHAAKSEAEQHRQELETTGAYLESVLANLSAGVLAFDGDFRLRAANRGAVAILSERLLDENHLVLQEWPHHQDFARAIIAAFQVQGERWQQQLDLTGTAGTPQTLLMRGSTLPTNGGYVVVFDDITQLISAERIAAWGEVARRLAHEIKNPLTPIQLSAERLQRRLSSTLTPEARALLERATSTIVTQVEAMKNMVNDFRDYARTPPPEIAAVNLNDLLVEILALYEDAGRALHLSLSPDLPCVQADAGQLRQVLHNILKNAVEASAGGHVDISIRTTIDDSKHRARLTIADRGSGFAPQILSRACEPYVSSKAKGTGLGLAIVKKIIDDHHGELLLANRDDGGGALVTLFLPLVR